MKRKVASSLILLSVVSIIAIGYLILKDYFLPTTQQLALAEQFEASEQYPRAEHYYLMVLGSDDKELVAKGAYQLGRMHKKNKENFFLSAEKARVFLTISAKLNYAPALYELALLYDVGDKIKEDRQQAIMYMQQAVALDYPPALYVKGVWIDRGYFADLTQQDKIDLYEKSANLGYPLAMSGLISLYRSDNPQRAEYWFKRLQELNQQITKK